MPSPQSLYYIFYDHAATTDAGKFLAFVRSEPMHDLVAHRVDSGVEIALFALGIYVTFGGHYMRLGSKNVTALVVLGGLADLKITNGRRIVLHEFFD